ncbi:MAG: porin [Caulobacteraceae bacterium]|nr:porin [Caulobacteraceae bacterium]
MRKSILLAAVAGAGFLATPALAADGLRWDSGDWAFSAHLAGSAQAGDASEDLPPASGDTTHLDGYVRLNADWTSDDGWTAGANLEASTNDRETEALNTGEIYVYVASELGRLEIGKQDGAADALALRAPVIALGQVRGDFARYAGSQALLSAYDSGDAPKVVFLSAPYSGLRVGVSWAPQDNRDDLAGLPVKHHDVVELGAQFERPVGDWVLGISGGYVTSQSVGVTQDIRSWSVGVEAKRGPLRLGAGYVDRGDSNQLFIDFDQREWSVGAAWVKERWGVAASAAWSEASVFDNQLLGIGGFFNLNDYVTLRADVVHVDEERFGLESQGVVGLAEIEFHY